MCTHLAIDPLPDLAWCAFNSSSSQHAVQQRLDVTTRTHTVFRPFYFFIQNAKCIYSETNRRKWNLNN